MLTYSNQQLTQGSVPVHFLKLCLLLCYVIVLCVVILITTVIIWLLKTTLRFDNVSVLKHLYWNVIKEYLMNAISDIPLYLKVKWGFSALEEWKLNVVSSFDCQQCKETCLSCSSNLKNYSKNQMFFIIPSSVFHCKRQYR